MIPSPEPAGAPVRVLPLGRALGCPGLIVLALASDRIPLGLNPLWPGRIGYPAYILMTPATGIGGTDSTC